MLEIKEKINSYCSIPLPKEGRINLLVNTFFVSLAVSFLTIGFTAFQAIKYNLLYSLENNLTLTFVGLVSVFIVFLCDKEITNNFSKVYPEKQNEAKNLLLQVVNTPKIFKVFHTQELKEDLKTLIGFIDKEPLSLNDLLTIRNILNKVRPKFEKEVNQKQRDEETKHTLLNNCIDNKTTQSLMDHLNLCADIAPGEIKEKKLYAQK